ncbi:MAG TPA: hypothetical protein V6C72_09345 [Chroococcales cyanobacterium]
MSLPLAACGLVGTSESNWKSKMALAFTQFQHKDFNVAERLYKECQQEAANFAADDLRKAQTDTELADVYLALNRPSDAEPLLERATNLYRSRWKSADVSLNNRDIGLHLASSAYKLGTIERDRGAYAAAETNFNQALQVEEKDLGSDQLKGEILTGKAKLLALMGKVEQSNAISRELEDLEPAAVFDLSSMAKKSWSEVQSAAESSFHGLDYANAEKLLRLALTKADSAPENERKRCRLRGYICLAQLYRAQSKFEEGAKCAKLALDNVDDPASELGQYIQANLQLAGAYAETNRNTEAINLLEKLFAFVCENSKKQKQLDREKEILDPLINNLVKIADYKLAEKYAIQKVEIDEQSLGRENYKVSSSLQVLAAIQGKMHKFKEGKALFDRSIAMNKRAEDPRRLIGTYQLYAEFLREADDQKGAAAAAAEAARLKNDFDADFSLK